MIVPFTLVTTDSDDKVNPPLVVAPHEYEPLSECCIDPNCSWLEIVLEMIFTRGLLSITGVLPSGGPSH